MLSISDPFKTTNKREAYYLALARVAYYLDSFNEPGRWYGKGARILGLGGKVTEEALRSLLKGYSPDRKKALVKNAGGAKRQGAWDLTFSAPKPVSVYWALAPDPIKREIEKSHEAALAVALEFLETKVGQTRRGKDGKIREHADLLFAVFMHYLSRRNEPQLHGHAVLLNLGFRSDGTTGAVRSKAFFEVKKVIGKIYQEELARQLVARLNVEIEWEKVGFHIKGVPKDLCRELSTRRKEVLGEMEAIGSSGAYAAKIAALATRTAKVEHGRQELFASWKAIAANHNWGQEEAAMLGRSLRSAKPSDTRDTERRESVDAERDSFKTSAAHTEDDSGIFRESWRFKAGKESQQHRGKKAEKSENVAEQTKNDGFKEEWEFAKGASDKSRYRKRAKQKYKKKTKATQSTEKSDQERAFFFGLYPRMQWLLMFPKIPKSSIVSSWKAPRVVFWHHSFSSKWGDVIWKKDFKILELRAQERRLFPNAPKWTGLKKLKVPAILFGNPKSPPAWEAIHWKKELVLGEIRFQNRIVFPRAPKWSPASKLKIPALRLAPKSPKVDQSNNSKECRQSH